MLNLFQKQTLLKISRKDDDLSKDPDKTDCMDGQKEERHDKESRKVDRNEDMPPDSGTNSTKSLLTSTDKKTVLDGKRSTLSITLSSAKSEKMQKHDVKDRNGKHFVQEIITEKNEQFSISSKKSEVGDLEKSKSNSENTQNENFKNLPEKNQQNSQTISCSEKSVPRKESDLEAMGEECNKSKSTNDSNSGLSDVSSLNKNPVKDNEVVDIKYKLAADVKHKSTSLEEKSNKVVIWIIFITLFYQ